jgi:hypothetical protein
VTVAALDAVEGEVFIRLTEYGAPLFLADRFRPLNEKTTDISALTALLNPANYKRQLEDA